MWQPAQPTLKGHPERYLFAAHAFCYSVITVRTENGGSQEHEKRDYCTTVR
jgi:hypothetical protein